ncbi:hypothetical protein MBANPS3_008009 [Mucor bainieri]
MSNSDSYYSSSSSSSDDDERTQQQAAADDRTSSLHHVNCIPAIYKKRFEDAARKCFVSKSPFLDNDENQLQEVAYRDISKVLNLHRSRAVTNKIDEERVVQSHQIT